MFHKEIMIFEAFQDQMAYNISCLGYSFDLETCQYLHQNCRAEAFCSGVFFEPSKW